MSGWFRDSLEGWEKKKSPWEMFLWCCSNSVTRRFGHIFSCPCGWHLINWLDKHTRSLIRLHVVMRYLISETAATVVTAPLKYISSMLPRHQTKKNKKPSSSDSKWITSPEIVTDLKSLLFFLEDEMTFFRDQSEWLIQIVAYWWFYHKWERFMF